MNPDDQRPDRPYYYGPARIVGGLLLIGAAVLLVLVDAVSLDYAGDAFILGLLLGGGGLLLGVEGLRGGLK